MDTCSLEDIEHPCRDRYRAAKTYSEGDISWYEEGRPVLEEDDSEVSESDLEEMAEFLSVCTYDSENDAPELVVPANIVESMTGLNQEVTLPSEAAHLLTRLQIGGSSSSTSPGVAFDPTLGTRAWHPSDQRVETSRIGTVYSQTVNSASRVESAAATYWDRGDPSSMPWRVSIAQRIEDAQLRALTARRIHEEEMRAVYGGPAILDHEAVGSTRLTARPLNANDQTFHTAVAAPAAYPLVSTPAVNMRVPANQFTHSASGHYVVQTRMTRHYNPYIYQSAEVRHIEKAIGNILEFVAAQQLVGGPWDQWLEMIATDLELPWLIDFYLRARVPTVDDLHVVLAQTRRQPTQFYANVAAVSRVSLKGPLMHGAEWVRDDGGNIMRSLRVNMARARGLMRLRRLWVTQFGQGDFSVAGPSMMLNVNVSELWSITPEMMRMEAGKRFSDFLDPLFLQGMQRLKGLTTEEVAGLMGIELDPEIQPLALGNSSPSE